MLVNARSLNEKTINKLVDILFVDENIDVCCITETWLKDSDEAVLADIKLRGYQIVNSPRSSNKRGGGVAFLCKDIYTHKHIKTSKYLFFELLEVYFSCKNTGIRFSTIYRTGNLNAQHRISFLEELNDYLESLLFKEGINVLWGDFNISKDQTINKKFYKDFLEMIESKGLKLIIDKPTHIKNGILDLVFVPCDFNVGNVTIFGPESGIEISDHFPIKLQIPVKAEKVESLRLV